LMMVAETFGFVKDTQANTPSFASQTQRWEWDGG